MNNEIARLADSICENCSIWPELQQPIMDESLLVPYYDELLSFPLEELLCYHLKFFPTFYCQSLFLRKVEFWPQFTRKKLESILSILAIDFTWGCNAVIFFSQSFELDITKCFNNVLEMNGHMMARRISEYLVLHPGIQCKTQIEYDFLARSGISLKNLEMIQKKLIGEGLDVLIC